MGLVGAEGRQRLHLVPGQDARVVPGLDLLDGLHVDPGGVQHRLQRGGQHAGPAHGLALQLLEVLDVGAGQEGGDRHVPVGGDADDVVVLLVGLDDLGLVGDRREVGGARRHQLRVGHDVADAALDLHVQADGVEEAQALGGEHLQLAHRGLVEVAGDVGDGAGVPVGGAPLLVDGELGLGGGLGRGLGAAAGGGRQHGRRQGRGTEVPGQGCGGGGHLGGSSVRCATWDLRGREVSVRWGARVRREARVRCDSCQKSTRRSTAETSASMSTPMVARQAIAA